MSEMSEKVRGMETALRDAGVRITRQRLAILDVLAAADHPDAVEVHQRARAVESGVSLSTVYRTLSELEARGVIQRHAFEGASARFETAAGAHHDHMIDVETGSVIEFRSDRIERLQNEIAAELGYEIVSHRMELYVRKLRAT
jgi:Fur family ferric uptake transcriptional regulator